MNGARKKSVKDFIRRWTGKGYEKGESQKFWIDLLQNVLGVPDATEYIIFEEQANLTIHLLLTAIFRQLML